MDAVLVEMGMVLAMLIFKIMSRKFVVHTYKDWHQSITFKNIFEAPNSMPRLKLRVCNNKHLGTIFYFFIAEKVNKAKQNTSVVKNIIFLCARRFLNGIIP